MRFGPGKSTQSEGWKDGKTRGRRSELQSLRATEDRRQKPEGKNKDRERAATSPDNPFCKRPRMKRSALGRRIEIEVGACVPGVPRQAISSAKLSYRHLHIERLEVI